MLARRCVLRGGVAALAAAPLRSLAQPYPARAIRIIVPFASGSGSDAAARWFADRMMPLLGRPLIVENRPGAEGAVGMMVAKSEPADGYTIVQGGISPSVVNAVMVKDLRYDPVRDFRPVLGYGRNMNVILVAPQSPFKTIDDLLSRRPRRESLNVVTFSTTLRLAVAWLSQLSGVPMTNIPYRGQGLAIGDVIGGQVDMAFVDLGGSSTLLRDGKVRALAVTGEARSENFPDIPTLRESGLKDYAFYSWNAFFVRSEVPGAICDRLADAVRTVMTSRDTIENYYKPRGTEGIPLSPARMRALQQAEIARFRAIAESIDELRDLVRKD